MKRILLVRHAATDFAGKLCGHLNPPLNHHGRAQAAALAVLLRNMEVDRLYASDLLRSIQTAEPLAVMRAISISENQGLREISFGAWEGMRWADLKAKNGLLQPGIESSPESGPPHGESFNHFRVRVKRCLDEIANEHSKQTIVVVTHLGVIRIALTELAGIPSGAISEIDYCSIHEFEMTGTGWNFVKRF